MPVLAGDIGGTKTLLQLAEVDPGQHYRVAFEQRYVSADWADLTPMVKEFLQQSKAAGHQRPQTACFGIAGPVSGRTARTTNLPWYLDADRMQQDLGLARVRLINDFQSVGYGIEVLGRDDIVEFQAGREARGGTRVIIGAGTGLGQGLLIWQGEHYEVVASEGGHSDFAPTDEEQIGLLRHIQARFGRCTWERVVSGTGIGNLHDYLRSLYPGEETSALHAARQQGDAPAAISQAAREGSDPLAQRTMTLFCRLYGAQAGNLALTGLATGGVYVAGGVAPRIIDRLQDGQFLKAFLNKEERMQDLLRNIPLRVVVNPKVGLMGSAVAATRL